MCYYCTSVPGTHPTEVLFMKTLVTIDGAICQGRPTITGTRVEVATVLSMLANGDTLTILAVELALHKEQIKAAIGYGAEMVRAAGSLLPDDVEELIPG